MLPVTERNRLIDQFEGLAKHEARRAWGHSVLAHKRETRDDLVQICRLGLIKATRGYNPDHPSRAKFITYATRVIRHLLHKHLVHNGLIAVPEAQARLMRENRGNPARAADANRAWNIVQWPAFWNQSREATESRHALLDPRRDPERLHNCLKRLYPDERKLIDVYFGFGEHRAHTLKEIAQQTGVSCERIRQRMERALSRLRREIVRSVRGRPCHDQAE